MRNKRVRSDVCTNLDREKVADESAMAIHQNYHTIAGDEIVPTYQGPAEVASDLVALAEVEFLPSVMGHPASHQP